jgi:exodeoxyribonuclease VII small subunit
MTAGERGFEELMTELETTVRALEREELALDEALVLFERGVGALREASRLLDAARGRVEEVVESSASELETLGLELEERAPARNGD